MSLLTLVRLLLVTLKTTVSLSPDTSVYQHSRAGCVRATISRLSDSLQDCETDDSQAVVGISSAAGVAIVFAAVLVVFLVVKKRNGGGGGGGGGRNRGASMTKRAAAAQVPVSSESYPSSA